jgi:hypothetical protein
MFAIENTESTEKEVDRARNYTIKPPLPVNCFLPLSQEALVFAVTK